MATKNRKLTAAQLEEMDKIVEKAMDEYVGDMTVLESAIGALRLGQRFGWHVLRLIHSNRTYRRYEQVLNVTFRDVLPERTSDSDRVNGIRMADQIGKFWQAVNSGTVPAKEARKVNLT